jgi:NarL family two-component system response regulator LiaR
MEKDQLIKPIRVITVDDHEILRGGIKFSLLAFNLNFHLNVSIN